MLQKDSHRWRSAKKGVRKKLEKFTGKHQGLSLFFNKVAGLIKKRLQQRCFHMNFAELLRTPPGDCIWND